MVGMRSRATLHTVRWPTTPGREGSSNLVFDLNWFYRDHDIMNGYAAAVTRGHRHHGSDRCRGRGQRAAPGTRLRVPPTLNTSTAIAAPCRFETNPPAAVACRPPVADVQAAPFASPIGQFPTRITPSGDGCAGP